MDIFCKDRESRHSEIVDELLCILPHGSGIDCDWHIEFVNDRWICTNSYHLMDEHGYYDGYQDFTVTIFRHKKDKFNPLKGPCEGQIQVIHRKGDVDFRITFQNRVQRNSAYMLQDYLYEVIDYALRNILTHRNEVLNGS